MNKKGQALIESLFVGIIITVGLGLFLKLFFKIQKRMVLEELAEETLVCLVEKKSNCKYAFQNQLQELGLKNISIQTNQTQMKCSLRLNAISSFNEKIEFESELEYDTKIPI